MATLPNISPDLIKAYQEQIKGTSSEATLKRKSISLNRFFNWAEKNGKIQKNPLAVEAPKEQQKENDITTQTSKTKTEIGFKTYMTVGLTACLVLIIFLLTRQLKITIPFITNFAQSSNPVTNVNIIGNNQNTASNSGSISANSAGNNAWNLYTKLKLTDSNGTPQVGSETLSFKLYNSDKGGDALYTSSPQTITTDANGSALISLSDVPSNLYFQNEKLFLEPIIASSAASARIPVSTASVPQNLNEYPVANPDNGAGPLSVPVIDSTGSLNLASQAPAVIAKQGNLLIEGQTVTVQTPPGSNGNIEFNPDGSGYAHFLFDGNNGNFLNAQGPNLTSGSLFYGMVPNGAIGYDLIKLDSGSPRMTTRFSVDALGNTFATGNINSASNLQTSGISRVSSSGALENITGYTQNSGNFVINQNPGDFAAITKHGTALSDVVTLTLDERPKPMFSNTGYSTLVLNRYDGSAQAMALLVNNGNAQFNGLIRIGQFSSNPTPVGPAKQQGGDIYFSTTDNLIHYYDGSNWQTLGTAVTTPFSLISSGTNTSAAMIVGSGASLNFSGTGTINASSLNGLTSGEFLRSDASSNLTSGTLTTNAGTTLNVAGTLQIAGTTVNSTAAEINFLHGSSVTAGGVIYGNGTNFANSGIGSTGQLLSSGGSGTPTWVNIASALTPGTDISITGTTNATINDTSTLNSVTGRGATTSNAITVGNLTSTGTTTFNGITYTWPSSQASNFVLSTNGAGTLSWSDPSVLIAASEFWNQATGALFPKNNGVDVLIGSNSTSSAKFAFTNVLTGTPTASISGSTANVAAYITGNGNLATTNMADLTVGGSTTGQVILNSRGSAALTANGAALTTGGDITIAGNAAVNGGSITTNQATFNLLNATATAINFGGAATTIGIGASSGTTTINNAASVKGNTTLGTNSSNTVTFNADIASNLIPSSTDTYNLGSSSSVEFNNIYGKSLFQNGNAVCDSSGANCIGGGGGFWGQTNGALYPLNKSVDLLIGAASGSTATTSAKFAFTGVNSGTPTASIAGTVANVATFIDGNGNVSSTNRNNLTLGNSSTYNTTGNILLNPNGTGDVGIGTISPNGPLSIAGSAGTSSTSFASFGGQKWRLQQNSGDETSAGVIDYRGFDSGSLNIVGAGTNSTNRNVHIFDTATIGYNSAPTAGVLAVNGYVGIGTNNPAGMLHIYSAGSGTSQLRVGEDVGLSTTGQAGYGFLRYTDGSLYTDMKTVSGGKLYFRSGAGAETGFARTWMTVDPSNGNVGLGTTSPTVTLDVNGNASVSGTLAFHSGTGTIQSTTFSPLVIGGSTTGNITLNPSNAIAGGNVSPNTTDVTDLGTSSSLEYRNIYGKTFTQNGNTVCDSSNNCSFALGTNYWQLNNKILSPNNSTYDLAVGGTATGSAFQVFGIEQATGDIEKLNSTVITSGNVFEATASAITTGNIISLGQGGNSAFSGNGIAMSFDNTGGGGGTFTGDFELFKNAGSTKYTVDSTGSLTAAGNATVQGATGVTLSGTAANISFSGSGNHAISLSNSTSSLAIDAGNTGTLKLNSNTTGDIQFIGGSGGTGCTITNATGNLTCSGNLGANGGSLTTTQSTGHLFDATASTVDIGGAAGNVNIGAANVALTLNGNSTINGGTGSGGTLTFVSTTNATKGNLQFFSSSNTLDSSGNLTLAGNAAVNGGGITTTATTGNIFTGNATTINIGINGSGTINTGGGSGANGCTFNDTNGTLTCAGNIASTETSGTQGWWQLNNKVLAPANTTYDLTVGGSATGSAFQVFGAQTAAGDLAKLTSTVATTGNVFEATAAGITSGNLIKLGQGGDTPFTGDAILADLGRTGAGGSSFTGNFIQLNNNNVNRYQINSLGDTTITSPATTQSVINETATSLTSGNFLAMNSDSNRTAFSFTPTDENIAGKINQTQLASQTTVDTYVYDTTKDPDGGLWTNDERAKSSSWYNETINHASYACVIGTDTRCGRREFPTKAILVATQTNLFIFDAKDNTLWMAFNKGSGVTEQMIGPTTSSTGTSVYALNGKIYFTNSGSSGGTYVIDLIGDSAYKYNSTAQYNGNQKVSGRNSTVTWATGPGQAIVATSSEKVSAAMINGKEYFAVATDGGTNGSVTLMDETDRTVANYGISASIKSNLVYLLSDGTLYATIGNSSTPTAYALKARYNAIADSGNNNNFSAIYANLSSSNYGATTTDAAYGSLVLSAGPAPLTTTSIPNSLYALKGTSTVDGKSNTIYLGTGDNLMAIEEKQGSEASGSVKYYHNDYITEQLFGDIRAMWPMNANSARNATYSGTIAQGAFVGDASVQGNNVQVAGGAVTIASGVRSTGLTFSGTNYLSCANAACGGTTHMDIGSGNWSLGSWINTAKVPKQTILAKGNASTQFSYELYLANGGAPVFDLYNNTAGATPTVFMEASSSAQINDGNWHHVVGTYDGTTIKIYADGILQASSTTQTGTQVTTSSSDFQIAERTDIPANAFIGTMDEPFVTANALTYQEVRHIYEVGSRALQNHTVSRITGVTGADNYQRLMGNATGGTSTSNNVNAVAVDSGNQFIYAGIKDKSSTTGGVTVVGIDSDTALDLYDNTANTTKKTDGNSQFSAFNVVALSVSGFPCIGYNSGTTNCSSKATIAIMGLDGSSNNQSWMETTNTSLYSTLAALTSPTAVKNAMTVNNTFQVFNTYNHLDSTTTGNNIQTPSMSVDSNGNFVYNYFGPNTTTNAMALTDKANLTTGNFMNITASSALTTGSVINVGSAQYQPAAGASGSLANFLLTDAATNTSGNSIVNGENIATTLNTSGSGGTKEFNAYLASLASTPVCTSGSCTWSGIKINTAASGAPSTLTSYGVNVNAAGVGAGTLIGLNVSNITAGGGTQTALQIGSGWNTDLNFVSTTPKIAFTAGAGSSTLTFSDGTNNLVQILDESSTGRLAVSDSLQVGSLTSLAYSRFGTTTTSNSLTTSSDVLISGKLELHGVLYLDGQNISNNAGTAFLLSCTGASGATCGTTSALENTLTAGSWIIDNNANVGEPALAINQEKGGPLLTASASGVTKFTITNAGFVGIGTTPGKTLDVAGDIRLTGKFFDSNVTGGIGLGDSSNTALVGFGDGTIVGALNELKNSNAETSHNDYTDWANQYLAKAEGTLTNPNMTPQGLFFDTFSDATKMDSVNSTSSGAIQISNPTNFSTKPAAPFRVGLSGGQLYATSTSDNGGNTYLGSNTVNKVFYYDRTRDSSPQVQVELGIDPNWYNGVTLAVATTSAQLSQNDTIYKPNPNLSTSYNGSLIKATGTYASNAQTIYVTIVSPTTFNWTDYNGNSANAVAMTQGTAQALGGTGVSVTFTNTTYNVGDVFKVASWFVEPSFSIRGAKAQFPERSYVITETSTVDIIDADTQKLWMRISSTAFRDAGTNTSTQVLNGILYKGDASGVRRMDFTTDRDLYYYQAAGGLTQTNANPNIASRNTAGTALNVINSTLKLVAAPVNDVSTAVIPNQPTSQVTVSGWGYIIGNGTGSINEAVNLPYKFNSAPLIQTNVIGSLGGSVVPKTPQDCTSGQGATVASNAYATTQSNFDISMVTSSGTFATTTYTCYTWTATGTVSPKQFVAVATGTSGGGGGTTIINETDGSSVNDEVAANIYQNKVALTNNGSLYMGYYASTVHSYLVVHHGIAGQTSSEGSVGQYRGGNPGYYCVGSACGFNEVINGTDTGNNIKSLAVTAGTSTIDGSSNTIYVGTDTGVSVIQEKQSHGNLKEGSDENNGSVKYYTNNYVSEEMVSDIRGMWPLSSNGALSMNDVSIKGNTLTNNGSATAITGVRGAGVSLNGSSQYLSCTDANCGGSTKLGIQNAIVTIGAWIKTSANNVSIVSKFNVGSTGAYDLGIGSVANAAGTANTLHFTTYNGTTQKNISGNIVVNDNRWHFVVATSDGTTAKLYVDGQFDNSGGDNSSYQNATAASFAIGADFNSSTATNFFNGSIDGPFITAVTLSASQIKHMYDIGARALQSHATTLGGAGADQNQQLGGSTNTIGDARSDYNNQFMYVGTNDATNGRVSKIDLNSDTNLKTFDKTTNTPTGGTKLANDDTNSLAVSYNLEAVSSATTGVESMSPDNNSNNLTGSLFSKTQTLNSNTKFAYLWTSFVVDSSDTSNGINVYACNNFSTKALCDSNSAWVLGTIANTDSTQTPPEREYTFSFPNAGSSMTFKFDFARGSTKTNTYITRYGATWASSVGGADIAERYQSTEPVFPGDVLSIASPITSGTASVSMSRSENDPKIIGVVTTNPGIVMDNNLVDLNFNASSRNSPDRPAVALAGRVPINVSTKNGAILVGDPLTSSTVPGYAVKSTHVGNIVAKALEAFSCSSPNAIQMPDGTCQGQVLALINVSWFDPSIYLTDTGDLHITSTQSASLANSNQSPTIIYQIVRVLTDGTKEIVDKIGTFASLVAGNISAGFIQTQDLVAENLIAKVFKTNLISPLPNSTDVAVQIGSVATPSGQFVIQNASGSAVASIDNLGNATFSGEVHSQNLDQIQSVLNQVQADQALLAQSGSWNTNTATGSANINQLTSTDLYVTDQAAINSLSVTKTATIGTDLVLGSDNSINTLSAPLKIQSLALAPVEIMDGLVSIDTKGNVAISGNLNVAGRINSSGLTLKDNPTFDVTASPSASLLSLQDSNGNTVSSVDASGSANFNSLSAQQLVIAGSNQATSSAVINGVLTANTTVGSAVILAGSSQITINNPKVTDYTLVYVTPTSSTNNFVLYVKSKVNGQFVVGFTTPIPQDVTFNWWIVQTQ